MTFVGGQTHRAELRHGADPIAMAVAMEASPYPFAMIVALAASGSHMTPVSSPANTMIAASGNYEFGAFARVGGPLTVIVLPVNVLLVPRLLPLR
jgi:di/tricarboxylate transporter